MDEARKKLMRLKDEMLKKKKKREALRQQTINMCDTANCSGCGCYQSNRKRYENGFCKDCFPTGYSAVTGDPIKKEMNLKEALYMLFNEQYNFHDCHQLVFDFIRRHVASHFERLNLKFELTDAIKKSFNMNIKCSSYDTITIENGKTVQTKDEENTERIFEVFEPHLLTMEKVNHSTKFYVDQIITFGFIEFQNLISSLNFYSSTNFKSSDKYPLITMSDTIIYKTERPFLNAEHCSPIWSG